MKKIYVLSLFWFCFDRRRQVNCLCEEHGALSRVGPLCPSTCSGFMLFLSVCGESILIGNLIETSNMLKAFG